MFCNLKKCNEVIRGEKVAHDIRTELQNIPQVSSSKMLGVSSQSNNSFNEHMKVRRIFLELNSKGLYPRLKIRKKITVFFAYVILKT